MNHIFVVGTGRCGSSILAKVLHERCGCCMGHQFRTPDKRNPQGYWEDLFFRKTVLHDLANNKIPAKQVLSFIEAYHIRKQCKSIDMHNSIIGYKHPLLAEITYKRWLEINPACIFWAFRPKEMVVASLQKWGKKNYTSVILNKLGPEQFFDDKIIKLTFALEGIPNVVKIDFSEQRDINWIETEVKKALGGLQ